MCRNYCLISLITVNVSKNCLHCETLRPVLRARKSEMRLPILVKGNSGEADAILSKKIRSN